MLPFLRSIRVRTLAVLLGLVAGVLVGLGLWAHQHLRQAFERLEAAEVGEDLRQVQRAFDEQCEDLITGAVWWSRTPPLSSEPELGVELPGNAALMAEVELGTVPHLERIALGPAGEVRDIPAVVALLATPSPEEALGTSGRALHRSGERLLLTVWSYRVISNGKVGAVVGGLWLDDAFALLIERHVSHPVQLLLRSADDLRPAQARQLDGEAGQILIARDEDELTGHLRLDITGGPLVAVVSLDRGIVAAGEITWGILMVAIAITGILLAVAAVPLLEAMVLARVTRMGRQLSEIAQTNDPAGMVDSAGSDEIAELASEINRLLASQRGWREQITRRNSAMRLIFDTLPIGLLSLDEHGRIQPERSMATADLLGRHDLDGLELGELAASGPAGAITRSRLADFLQIVRGGSIAAEDLDEVNPVKVITVQRPSGPLFLRLRFYRIDQGSHTTRRIRRETGMLPEASGVLVTLTDISDERRLAEEVERSHADFTKLKAMAEDVDLFNGFLERIRAVVVQLNELSSRMGSSPTRVQLLDLQRNVRALRQGGDIFGLAPLEQAARNFDGELVRFIGLAHLSDFEVRRCRYGVADLEAAVIAIERQFRVMLGDGGTTSTNTAVPVRTRLAPDVGEVRVAKRTCLVRLRGLLVQPVRLALAATIRMAMPMARRRAIDLRLTIQGEEVVLEQANSEVLNQVLPHLLRFVFNYGIEDADERTRAGKPVSPSLTLGIERQERQVVVTLVDDGRGIDPAQMRALAIERGLLTPVAAAALDDQAAQALVFSVTGDAEDSSLSGVREVGLDLIVQRLKDEYDADITIQSTPRVGTAVIITMPLADE